MAEPYRELVVRSGEQGKGRSFRGVLLAYATAPVWDKHVQESVAVRPVLLVVGCQAQEAAPVAANLRAGHPATVTGDGLPSGGVTLECLKSARYAWTQRRVAGGVTVTGRLPGVTALDPGVAEPDEPVRFLVAPPRSRLDGELTLLPSDAMRAYGEALVGDAFVQGAYAWMPPDLRREDEEWRCAPALALWFCAAVDRRVSVPVLPDPLFQMRFYLAALRTGLAGWAVKDKHNGRDRQPFGRRGPVLTEWGYGSAGLAPGVACAASQSALRELLAEEVRAWNADNARARLLGGAEEVRQAAAARGKGRARTARARAEDREA